jgi:hypothetical protein
MHEAVTGTPTAAREERAFFLQLEKDLSTIHQLLSGRLKAITPLDLYEVEAPVQSALWALGVAVLQVAKLVGEQRA